jgi:tetratricopeptide (TPR) repeat protein
MNLEEFYSIKRNRARELMEKGKYGEAEEEIQEALQEAPDHPMLKTTLADLYRRQGRLSEARILAEEILAHDPQHLQALCVLGDIFLKQRSFPEALECYRQASNRDPRPHLILRAARALKEMRNFSEALQELEKVLVVQRQNISFLKEKALILNRMKKFDEALDSYERIKEIQPDDRFVQKEILRLRSRTRPGPQVLKELQAVVGMPSKKGDAQVHGLLAQKLKDAGLVREAAAEYRAASTLEPDNLYFLKQQGFCHYRLKKYDEAIQCLAEAFRKDPLDYVVRKTLQTSYESQGNLRGFLDLVEETFGHHPHSKPLLGTIKKVRNKLNLKASQDL